MSAWTDFADDGFTPYRPTPERRMPAEPRTGGHGISSAFALCYQCLPHSQRRLLRLLGMHPGIDFDPCAAAALAGTTPHEAGTLLTVLADVRLLLQAAPARYRFPDAIRPHAHALDSVDEPAFEWDSVLTRLADYYLHAASAAADVLAPARRRFSPGTAEVPTLTGHREAITWLETEHANIAAVVSLVAERRWHTHGWQIPQALRRFYFARDHSQEAVDAPVASLSSSACGIFREAGSECGRCGSSAHVTGIVQVIPAGRAPLNGGIACWGIERFHVMP